MATRLDKLVAILKQELDVPPEEFRVNIIQLYYSVDELGGAYDEVRREDVTRIVAV